MAKKKKNMTPKMKRFCDLYLTSSMGNATDAAKRAGYSKKTAYSIGQENLSKPEIIKYIEKRRAKFEELFMQDVFDVMNKNKTISDFNMKDLYDENSNLIPISELPRDIAYAISSTKTIRKKDGEEYDTIDEIKVEGKSKALAELGKMKKLYEEYTPQEVIIKIGYPDEKKEE